VDTGRALCDIEPLDVEDPVNRTMHNGFFVEQIREHRTRVDTTLAGIILLLVVVGLGMLLSASWFRAEQLYGDPLRFVMRQGMWVGVGIIGLILAYVMPLERVRKALPFLVLVTIVLSLLTFLPGVSARYMGARRWIIVFNVSFQPSELVKVVLVIYLAHILSRSGGDFSRPLQSLLPPAVIVSLFAVIVLRQNDYSTSVFLVLVALAMFFVAGVPTTHFVRIFVLVMPISLILLFTREQTSRKADYRFSQSRVRSRRQRFPGTCRTTSPGERRSLGSRDRTGITENGGLARSTIRLYLRCIGGRAWFYRCISHHSALPSVGVERFLSGPSAE